MPKLGRDMEVFQAGAAGTFQFSGAKPESLSAVEYTLASIVVDVTGSVSGFAFELLGALRTAVEACHKAPRADNLLLRVTSFNSHSGVQELHGFIPLQQLDTASYQPFKCDGMTNLYDAVYEAIEAANRYAKILTEQDFMVNGAIYIITDGDDNNSRRTLKDVKQAIETSKTAEVMESMHAALIGINDAECHSHLQRFQQAVGLSQYVAAGAVTPGNLAKLAAFVSKSISAQSQALGTGGPSQNLIF